MGVLIRLQEEGAIKKMVSEVVEEQEQHNAQKFAAEVRKEHHQHHHEKEPSLSQSLRALRDKQNGGDLSATKRHYGTTLRAPECVLCIMQRDPGKEWYYKDLGEVLQTDFSYHALTVSPTLSTMKHHGYVQQIRNGHYILTDLGKNHSQNDPLPFDTHT